MGTNLIRLNPVQLICIWIHKAYMNANVRVNQRAFSLLKESDVGHFRENRAPP